MDQARGYNASPSIWVSDDSALIDEKVQIRVTGLDPEQEITVTAGLQEGKIEFISHGHYQANKIGELDLEQNASLGGTYTGQDSMGLFWSMIAAKNMKKGVRLFKKDVSQPYKVKLSVLNGHQKIESLIEDNEKSVLSNLDIFRWYMKNVDKVTIREGRLRATLFTPKGGGTYPGVIDLFGTAGGILEFRASLLASSGFTVLALAYFDYDDLPKGIEFDYDYFDEAVKWFADHPKVNDVGVGVIGVSKGAEIALHMACYNEKVKACAALGGLPFYSFGVHTYKGKNINTHIGTNRIWDFVTMWKSQNSGRYAPPPEGLHEGHPLDLINFTEEGIVLENCSLDRDGADWIPFEKSGHCELLLIQGDDDRNTGANQTDKMAARLDLHGLSNYRVLNYPGTGHLIEPPYTPLSRVTYHKLIGSNMLYGGNPVEHAKAQEDSWKQIISLMRNKLGGSSSEQPDPQTYTPVNHVYSKL